LVGFLKKILSIFKPSQICLAKKNRHHVLPKMVDPEKIRKIFLFLRFFFAKQICEGLKILRIFFKKPTNQPTLSLQNKFFSVFNFFIF